MKYNSCIYCTANCRAPYVICEPCFKQGKRIPEADRVQIPTHRSGAFADVDETGSVVYRTFEGNHIREATQEEIDERMAFLRSQVEAGQIAQNILRYAQEAVQPSPTL